MHKILFYNKFITHLYTFRALCVHHQEVKLYYTVSGIVTHCRWPSGAHVERLSTAYIFHNIWYHYTYRVWWYQMLY